MKDARVLAVVLLASLGVAVGTGGVSAGGTDTDQTVRLTKLVPGPVFGYEQAAKFAGHPEYVRANYYSIMTHVRQHNADYVAQARGQSPTLEDAIKKHGLTRVVDIGNTAHGQCLDLAMERIKQQMPREEFDRRTKEIARQYYTDMHKVNVSAPIDFTKDVVIRASQQKVILDARFYEKLLRSNAGTTADYERLLASAYSEEEYSVQIARQLSAIDGIYDALLESRVGFRGLFAVSGINKSRDFRKQYCREQAAKECPAKQAAEVLASKNTKSSAVASAVAGTTVQLAVVVPSKSVK